MTEQGDYCIDVMQQNLAVIGLLKIGAPDADGKSSAYLF